MSVCGVCTCMCTGRLVCRDQSYASNVYYCLCHSLETGLFADSRAKLASERPLNLPVSTHDHAQLCVYLLGIRTQIFMFANKALLASEPSPQYLILFFV